MRKFFHVSVLLGCLFLSGCGGNYYLLTSSFVMSSQQETPPEIIETPTYKLEASKIKTVAVKAPDSCSNKTADERTGGASTQEAVLRTNCGVEMAEIERALTKSGYKVISWKIMASQPEVNNHSATQIAGNLGAQLLFQINSLEKSYKGIGKDARWERSYFESNEYGDSLKEHAFDEGWRSYLKTNYFDPIEISALNSKLKWPAVTLDANAVSVKDGESIWFYRWTHTNTAAVNHKVTKLVWCKRDCLEMIPERRSKEDVKDTVSSGESEAVSITEKPDDANKALYDSLLREIVTSLVNSFAAYKK